MFDKLISALPYNPSIIHQLSFYAKRVRKESVIRRAGLVFIVLGFIVQFFAFVSPPQATLAESPNDLVNGGFGSASQAAYACTHNLKDNTDPNTGANVGYGDILANYGITCDEVASAPTIKIASTETFDNKPLISMGVLQQKNFAGQEPVTIDGATYYVRPLSDWDTGGASTYYALDVIASTGVRYFLLFTCGNLVSIGYPVPVVTPPPPKPKPCTGVITPEDFTECVVTSKKAINITQGNIDATNQPANAGDLIKYELFAKNTGTGEVKDYTFSDNLGYVLDYSTLVALDGSKLSTGTQELIYPKIDIAANQTASVYFEVKVDNPIPQTPPSSSDPDYYNMEMVNTYGNTIIIHLPISTTKQIETTTTALPNTGPGSGVIIAAAVMAFAGFFYYRSRLLAKESTIAITESRKGL